MFTQHDAPADDEPKKSRNERGHAIRSQALVLTFECKTSENDTSKHRGSIYALFMVIHCPNDIHRIPNVSLGVIFKILREISHKDRWVTQKKHKNWPVIVWDIFHSTILNARIIPKN